jgi:hypothetical protein
MPFSPEDLAYIVFKLNFDGPLECCRISSFILSQPLGFRSIAFIWSIVHSTNLPNRPAKVYSQSFSEEAPILGVEENLQLSMDRPDRQ